MDETVKGLSWQLLFGNYRTRLGAGKWDLLVERVGGPVVREIDADDDLPMEPFNAMLNELDRELGQRPAPFTIPTAEGGT